MVYGKRPAQKSQTGAKPIGYQSLKVLKANDDLNALWKLHALVFGRRIARLRRRLVFLVNLRPEFTSTFSQLSNLGL